MAKPAWITLSKSSGTGQASVSVTASNFKGNTARSGVITGQATSGTRPGATLSVKQSAAAEFSEITEILVADKLQSGTTDCTVPAGATNVTVKGISNDTHFYFTPAGGSFLWAGVATIKINGKYLTADGTLTTSVATIPFTGSTGKSITLNPNEGASDSYSFEITAAVPAYSIAYETRLLYFGIYDKTVNITQSAAASTFSFSKESLTFAASSPAAQSVDVVSNDKWNLS